MTSEAIAQAAKTILETFYQYETALQNNDKKNAEKLRVYIMKLCESIKNMVQEERQNA